MQGNMNQPIPPSGAVPPAGTPNPSANPNYAAWPQQGAPGMPQTQPVDYRTQVPESLRPGKHQVHQSYVWMQGLKAALAVIIASLASLSSLFTSGIEAIIIVPLIIGFVVIVAALVFALTYFGWKYLSYELEPNELNHYSGVFNKRRRHVPYQRIQSVNQSADVIQRLIGVCDVNIETAGGAANEAIRLKNLRASEVEALRTELFRRKRVLLDGGSIDEWGSATVNGVVYPSAWALASYGQNPATAQPSPYASYGMPVAAAPVMPGQPQMPGQANTAVDAQGRNVLDGLNNVNSEFRGVFAGNATSDEAVQYETGLSNKELLLAGISGSGAAAGAFIAAIVGAGASVLSLFEGFIERSIERGVESALETGVDASSLASAAADSLGPAVWFMAISIIGIVVFVWVVSALSTMLQYGSFRLRRRGSRVELEMGLLKRTFQGIDVDRVQAISIEQNFIRRIMGYCTLRAAKIDSSAGGQEEQQGSVSGGIVIHPFVKLDRAEEILHGVLPEFADYPEMQVRPPKQAKRRAFLRQMVWRSGSFWVGLLFAAVLVLCLVARSVAAADADTYALFTFMAFASAAVLVLCVASEILDAVRASLWFKNSGLGFSRDFLRITNAGISQLTVVLPRKKIQFAGTRANPFQRRVGVATVEVVTAAGVGGTTEQLYDLAEQDAEALIEWVRPRKR